MAGQEGGRQGEAQPAGGAKEDMAGGYVGRGRGGGSQGRSGKGTKKKKMIK